MLKVPRFSRNRGVGGGLELVRVGKRITAIKVRKIILYLVRDIGSNFYASIDGSIAIHQKGICGFFAY